MNEPPLTKSELEVPRTAADMLAWVYSAHDRFAASKELRNAARNGEYFAKELVDEALPIALFASRYYQASPNVTITHVIGNQKYDALLDDRRVVPSLIKYIEVTVSNRDYDEALRMELLGRDGHAPAYGGVTAKGSKRRRLELSAQLEAFGHDELRDKHIKKVIAVVEKKALNKYPNDTALVVLIDDSVPFSLDADIAALDRVASETLVSMLSGREFCALAIVGPRGAHLVYEL